MAHIFHNCAAWEECSSPADNERHGGCGGAILWHWMVEPDVIATCVMLRHDVDVGGGRGRGGWILQEEYQLQWTITST